MEKIEDISKWKDTPPSWNERNNIAKMSVVPKAI